MRRLSHPGGASREDPGESERGEHERDVVRGNAITYDEVFAQVMANNLWFGYENGGTKWFQVPDDYEITTESRKKVVDGIKYFSMGRLYWYTIRPSRSIRPTRPKSSRHMPTTRLSKSHGLRTSR